MRLGILTLTKSKSLETYSLVRLTEAGQARGHQVEIILETDVLIKKQGEMIEVTHSTIDLKTIDGFLVKPSFSEDPSLHAPTTELMRRAGFRLFNDLPLGTLTKNKLTERVTLHDAGIMMPPWAIARSSEQAEASAKAIGFPIIIKVGFGSHGKGVFYADDMRTLSPIADYLLIRDKNPIVLERFIEEADHKDLRLFILGDQVIAAMERHARAEDVRANASLGGVGHTVELTNEEKTIAIKAAKAFGLSIAGVDLLRSKNGPLVMEVNANPGFEELERTTGVDVAGAIIDFITVGPL